VIVARRARLAPIAFDITSNRARGTECVPEWAGGITQNPSFVRINANLFAT